LEDCTTKLVHLLNVLLIEESIAEDNMSENPLISLIIDILNFDTANHELLLVSINYMSILSF